MVEEKTISKDIFEKYPDYNLALYYERASEELLNERGKIDNAFTAFVTLLSLATPYTLTAGSIGTKATSLMLFGIFMVGFILTLMVIQHRANCSKCNVCIDTLTLLMSIKKEELNRATLESACLKIMNLKMKYYLKVNKKGKKRLAYKPNIFLLLFREADKTYLFIMSMILGVVYSTMTYSYYVGLGGVGDEAGLAMYFGILVFACAGMLICMSYMYHIMCIRYIYGAIANDDPRRIKAFINNSRYLSFIHNENYY